MQQLHNMPLQVRNVPQFLIKNPLFDNYSVDCFKLWPQHGGPIPALNTMKKVITRQEFSEIGEILFRHFRHLKNAID